MSSSWFPFFSSDSVSKETIVPNSRDEDEVFPVAKELTSQERRSQSMSAIKCKLREERKSKSIAPGMNFSFDSIFRPISNIINDGSNSETGNEGIGVAHAHHVMNSNISCKYNLINPQQSGLDVTLEMHGFADSVAATYNTAGRYQLMYQRVTKLGGVLVGQWAVMPGMGMMPGMASAGGGAPAGNFFGMMEYPWRRHSSTVFSYLKGKQATVAHTERLIRGLHVGVSMKYEMDTHLTSNTYGAQFVTSDRKTTWAVEMNDHGSMKIGCVRKDWASDAQMAVELDVTDKRGAKISTLNLGLQKPLLGGGMMRICLLNFAKVRGVLELPFGGDRLGFNQMKIAYSMLYEAKSSSLKHGLMFTV